MEKIALVFLTFLILTPTYSQNKVLTKEDIKAQLNDGELIYADSEEDVRKIESLIESSKKIKYKEGIIDGKMNILSYLNSVSDYKKMLLIIDELENLGIENNVTKSTLSIYKADANKELGIKKEALKNLEEALKYSQLIDNKDKKHITSSYVYNRLGIIYDGIPDSMFKYQAKELKELEQIGNTNPDLKFQKHLSIALNKINTGIFYTSVQKPPRLDLAEPYFLEVYSYKTTYPDVFEELDMPILCGVGNFYLAKEDYQKSIKLMTEVLEREKRKKNPTYRSYAYSNLAEAYERLKNPKEQAKYTKLYATLNDSLNKVTKKEVNQQFEKLVMDAEKKYNSSLKTILIIICSLILVLAYLIWSYWRKKNRIIHKKYEALTSKINTEKINQDLAEFSEDSELKTTTNITDETTRVLIQKLMKFEKSQKYLRKDISRSWLAIHLNTNTKYLTEIIKIRSNNTFTNYIHNLRINYITRRLVEDPVYREYKIEYLAEECGYSSRQVFIAAFKKETGLTPSYFIENLKKKSLDDKNQ